MLTLQLYYDNLPKEKHKYFARILNNELKKINALLPNDKPTIIKVNANQTKTSLFKVKAILFLQKGKIIAEEEDSRLRTIVEEISNVLKENLIKSNSKNKNKKNDKIYYTEVPNSVFNLIDTHKEEKPTSFIDDLKGYLHSLNSYIYEIMDSAKSLNLNIDNIDSNDIFQQTIEQVLENFQSMPNNITLKQWLAQLANKNFKEALRENYRNSKNLSWEDLMDKEIDKLVEVIAIDAEQDAHLAVGENRSGISEEFFDDSVDLPPDLICEICD